MPANCCEGGRASDSVFPHCVVGFDGDYSKPTLRQHESQMRCARTYVADRLSFVYSRLIEELVDGGVCIVRAIEICVRKVRVIPYCLHRPRPSYTKDMPQLCATQLLQSLCPQHGESRPLQIQPLVGLFAYAGPRCSGRKALGGHCPRQAL